MLEGALFRLDRLNVDKAREPVDFVAVLEALKAVRLAEWQHHLRILGNVKGRQIERVRRAAHRVRPSLQTLVTFHNAIDPGSVANLAAPYEAALTALDRDPVLVTSKLLPAGSHRRGQAGAPPRPHMVAARRALSNAGVPPDCRDELLFAVGVLPEHPVARSIRFAEPKRAQPKRKAKGKLKDKRKVKSKAKRNVKGKR